MAKRKRERPVPDRELARAVERLVRGAEDDATLRALYARYRELILSLFIGAGRHRARRLHYQHGLEQLPSRAVERFETDPEVHREHLREGARQYAQRPADDPHREGHLRSLRERGRELRLRVDRDGSVSEAGS